MQDFFYATNFTFAYKFYTWQNKWAGMTQL